MPGEFFMFPCTDQCNVLGISCPAEAKLYLKRNARVMIVWNYSEDIKNGTTGTFLGLTDKKVQIDVEDYGKVFVKRESWSKRNRNGQNIGTRTQFPVVPFYACTCHKTQSLALPCVVVHCCREFVSGLIYVALRGSKVQMIFKYASLSLISF